MSVVSGISNCSAVDPAPNLSRPPTDLPYFSIENLKGAQEVLKSCCGNSPVANYVDANFKSLGDECFIYCNVTTAGLDAQKINACLDAKLKDATGITGRWRTVYFSPKNSASGLKVGGGIMGYLVVGLVLGAATVM